MSQEHPEAFPAPQIELDASRKRLRHMLDDIAEHAEAAKEHGESVDWDLLERAIEVARKEVA